MAYSEIIVIDVYSWMYNEDMLLTLCYLKMVKMTADVWPYHQIYWLFFDSCLILSPLFMFDLECVTTWRTVIHLVFVTRKKKIFINYKLYYFTRNTSCSLMAVSFFTSACYNYTDAKCIIALSGCSDLSNDRLWCRFLCCFFQSYQFDPDVCARLQNITQHGVIWSSFTIYHVKTFTSLHSDDQHYGGESKSLRGSADAFIF